MNSGIINAFLLLINYYYFVININFVLFVFNRNNCSHCSCDYASAPYLPHQPTENCDRTHKGSEQVMTGCTAVATADLTWFLNCIAHGVYDLMWLIALIWPLVAQYLQLGPWLVMESLSRISEGEMNTVTEIYELRSVIDFIIL